MKRIIITGSNGQDGIILSKILKKRGYKVFGFARKINLNSNNASCYSTLNKKFSQIKRKIDEIRPDTIVHLGSDNPSYKKKFGHKDYKKNLFFTKNLIDYVSANNEVKLIFASSSQIFKKTNKKVNENSLINKKNYYSRFRIDSAEYLLEKKKKFKLNATVIILFNHDSKYRNLRFLLPRLMRAIKENNILFVKKIYKDNISGDFSHAEDICNGIYLLINKNKNPDKLILCSAKRTYINNIITLFIKNFKKKKVTKKKIKEQKNLIGCNKLAKKIIGWKLNKTFIDAANDIYKNY